MRDRRGTAWAIAGIAVLLLVSPALAVCVVLTAVRGAYRTYVREPWRRRQRVARETQLDTAFARVADDMPELRAAEQRLTGLYPNPNDHLQES